MEQCDKPENLFKKSSLSAAKWKNKESNARWAPGEVTYEKWEEREQASANSRELNYKGVQIQGNLTSARQSTIRYIAVLATDPWAHEIRISLSVYGLFVCFGFCDFWS